jgi:SnoaL-like protein
MDLHQHAQSGTAGVASAVSRFLDAALSATIPECDVWADDGTIDVTTPGWRFHRRGPDAIRETYAGWFSEPGTFLELTRDPVADGEVVCYLISSTQDGAPYVAHHIHRLTVRHGRIVADIAFCGGRWSEQLQTDMAAADRNEASAGHA